MDTARHASSQEKPKSEAQSQTKRKAPSKSQSQFDSGQRGSEPEPKRKTQAKPQSQCDSSLSEPEQVDPETDSKSYEGMSVADLHHQITVNAILLKSKDMTLFKEKARVIGTNPPLTQAFNVPVMNLSKSTTDKSYQAILVLTMYNAPRVLMRGDQSGSVRGALENLLNKSAMALVDALS